MAPANPRSDTAERDFRPGGHQDGEDQTARTQPSLSQLGLISGKLRNNG